MYGQEQKWNKEKETVLTCWGADIWTILVSFDVISLKV